jgi:hypothetical protein
MPVIKHPESLFPAEQLLQSAQDVSVFVLPLYWPPGHDPQEPEELPVITHPESLFPAGQLLQSEQDVSVFVLPLYVPVSQFTHEVPLLFFPEPHSFVHLAVVCSGLTQIFTLRSSTVAPEVRAASDFVFAYNCRRFMLDQSVCSGAL